MGKFVKAINMNNYKIANLYAGLLPIQSISQQDPLTYFSHELYGGFPLPTGLYL